MTTASPSHTLSRTISRSGLFKRLLTSLAAILAVSAIFGVKASEWEHRAAAKEAEPATIATAQVRSGS